MGQTPQSATRADELATIAIEMRAANSPEWRQAARDAIAAATATVSSAYERARLRDEVVDPLASMLHDTGTAAHRFEPTDQVVDYDDETRGVWCECECGIGRWQHGSSIGRSRPMDARSA